MTITYHKLQRSLMSIYFGKVGQSTRTQTYCCTVLHALYNINN